MNKDSIYMKKYYQSKRPELLAYMKKYYQSKRPERLAYMRDYNKYYIEHQRQLLYYQMRLEINGYAYVYIGYTRSFTFTCSKMRYQFRQFLNNKENHENKFWWRADIPLNILDKLSDKDLQFEILRFDKKEPASINPRLEKERPRQIRNNFIFNFRKLPNTKVINLRLY